jgi:hypothetical protein
MITGSPNLVIRRTEYSPSLGSVRSVQMRSTGSVARHYLKGKQALRRGVLPRVAVDDLLRPAREVGDVLLLIMLYKKCRVLEEVVDATPSERAADFAWFPIASTGDNLRQNGGGARRQLRIRAANGPRQHAPMEAAA